MRDAVGKEIIPGSLVAFGVRRADYNDIDVGVILDITNTKIIIAAYFAESIAVKVEMELGPDIDPGRELLMVDTLPDHIEQVLSAKLTEYITSNEVQKELAPVEIPLGAGKKTAQWGKKND